MSENNHLREFGKFRLDAGKRVLWFEDQPINLPLKEIELLCALTEKGGEVITKNELLEKVWSDSVVEESSLSRHIYVLRKTFKDFGEEDLIQTIPRRGYRFAGEVREVQGCELVIEKHTSTRTLIEIQTESKPESGEANADKKPQFKTLTQSRVALSLAAVVLFFVLVGGFIYWNKSNAKQSAFEIKSIAVLPFKTIDANKENEHQGLGLTDVLITRLSNIKELNVRPTSAILAFENQSLDSASLGEKLKVDAVLEGTIYRTNKSVRVTARLIKTKDNSSLWAGQFEKPLQDELKLQNEISLQIVDALALNLSGNEKNALTKRYTENADAFQLYLKGRYHWNKRNTEGMIESEHLFRGAIEKDPNFAPAYTGLADTLATRINPEEAKYIITKALELDPNLAEAHATNGFIQMFHDWKWKEAEASFKKSIELNPNYATAHQWYATLLEITGKNAEAKTALRRALEINPISHNFLADLGQAHYFAREYKEAEMYCLKALEIYPDFIFAHKYLHFIYLQTGENEKAAEALIKMVIIERPFDKELNQKEATEKAIARNKDYLKQHGLKEFLSHQYLQSTPEHANAFYGMAMIYAFIGEKEKALVNLERANEGRAFISAFIKADPIFDNLREESRYRTILQKMNLN